MERKGNAAVRINARFFDFNFLITESIDYNLTKKSIFFISYKI